jgi:hypothetical protein
MAITMSSAVVRDDDYSVVVSLHGRADPSDAEWNDYLKLIDEIMTFHDGDTSRVRGLSVAAAGGPNATQRDEVNRRLRGQRVRVAIVTKGTVERGIVTALSWFNPAIRAFAPTRNDFAAALRHLEVPMTMHALLRGQLKLMRDIVPGAATIVGNVLGLD